ncbi:hypothetical protein ABK040_013937 [Willaertia magna]
MSTTVDNKTYRVATFNVENLLARYQFKTAKEHHVSKKEIPKRGERKPFELNDFQLFEMVDDTSKRITAEAIKEINADILCLQEVESLQVVDKFNNNYLDSQYTYTMLIDGRDPRGIDVAVLSKYPIVNVRTNRFAKNERNGYIFSRDLLEVDIDLDGKILTVYVTHLKSMLGGRQKTFPKRLEQVKYIQKRIHQMWKEKENNFILCGDFNDYCLGENDQECAVKLLLLEDNDHLIEVISTQLEEDRWTHYFARGKSYSQLDYLFLSKHLFEKNESVKPQIYRRGLPLRANRFKGERIEGVGKDRPKASDHCAVYMDIIL